MVPDFLRMGARDGAAPTAEELAFIREASGRFDGMMADLALVLFTALLREQTARGVSGDLIEFGVYRGKSAAVMALNAPEAARLHLIDIADYPEKDKLAPLHPNLNFIKSSSEDLIRDPVSDQFRDIRFSHHDASHYLRNVETEVMFIKDRMRADGLIILDDYGFHYAQVMAAYHYMRYVRKLPFEVFLVAGNKAFLCHEDMYPHYERLICEGFIETINAMGLNCFVARTDNDIRYRAFHIAPKAKPDVPTYYGVHFMGDRLYKSGAKPFSPD